MRALQLNRNTSPIHKLLPHPLSYYSAQTFGNANDRAQQVQVLDCGWACPVGEGQARETMQPSPSQDIHSTWNPWPLLTL